MSEQKIRKINVRVANPKPHRASSDHPVLSVENLHTSFITDSGEVKAVNGVSFNLDAGLPLGHDHPHRLSLQPHRRCTA